MSPGTAGRGILAGQSGKLGIDLLKGKVEPNPADIFLHHPANLRNICRPRRANVELSNRTHVFTVYEV